MNKWLKSLVMALGITIVFGAWLWVVEPTYDVVEVSAGYTGGGFASYVKDNPIKPEYIRVPNSKPILQKTGLMFVGTFLIGAVFFKDERESL